MVFYLLLFRFYRNFAVFVHSITSTQMRKIVTLLLVMSSIALGMQAQDYLALEVPELEPVLLNSAEMDDNHPHLSLSTIPTQQKRTNPVGLMEPVLPTPPNYKFMDDMTFVGVPLFVAGIIAKGEKKAFRQDYNNSHSNTRLITHFKTSIDDYTQYFGPALTLGVKAVIPSITQIFLWSRLCRIERSAGRYGLNETHGMPDLLNFSAYL